MKSSIGLRALIQAIDDFKEGYNEIKSESAPRLRNGGKNQFDAMLEAAMHKLEEAVGPGWVKLWDGKQLFKKMPFGEAFEEVVSRKDLNRRAVPNQYDTVPVLESVSAASSRRPPLRRTSRVEAGLSKFVAGTVRADTDNNLVKVFDGDRISASQAVTLSDADAIEVANELIEILFDEEEEGYTLEKRNEKIDKFLEELRKIDRDRSFNIESDLGDDDDDDDADLDDKVTEQRK